jgi:TldD protein
MLKCTRRQLLHTGAATAAASVFPWSWAAAERPRYVSCHVDEPTLKQVADAALTAAAAAGAIYADVNVRFQLRELYGTIFRTDLGTPTFDVRASLGVRALVNGYWGFVGLDGVATTDVAAQMGRDAATQAATAARGKRRVVELAPRPVTTGTWVMPVEIDPFTVSYEEKYDFLAGLNDELGRLSPDVSCAASLSLFRDDHTFASSDGSFLSQTTYTTQAGWGVSVPRDWMTEQFGTRNASFLTLAGAGWEYLKNAPVREHAMAMIEQALGTRRFKPIDVGRYDVVFDAQAMAGILDASIGTATELDRAMGYEANGVGTTYLNAPLDMLGTLQVASPLLTVTANRRMPGGAATVQWDDEGVVPPETTLVKAGVLTDYQTTRESASWLAPYYERRGIPVRSNGCGSALGSFPFTSRNPNLVMQPAAQHTTFEDLVKDTKRGLAIVAGRTDADYQVLNGEIQGDFVYEIVDGKLGKVIRDAVVLYRAPEFWRNLKAIGGTESAGAFGLWRSRMDEERRMAHTVSAVPAKVVGLAVTDLRRRA